MRQRTATLEQKYFFILPGRGLPAKQGMQWSKRCQFYERESGYGFLSKSRVSSLVVSVSNFGRAVADTVCITLNDTMGSQQIMF